MVHAPHRRYSATKRIAGGVDLVAVQVVHMGDSVAEIMVPQLSLVRAVRRRAALFARSEQRLRFNSCNVSIANFDMYKVYRRRNLNGGQNMSLVADAVTWSGWVFGAFSSAVSIDQIRVARKEKQRSKKMARLVTNAESGRPHLGTLVPAQATHEEIRSFLVHAAAGNQSFGSVVNRAKRAGVKESEVEHVARQLSKSGLLTYDGTLVSATSLKLKV